MPLPLLLASLCFLAAAIIDVIMRLRHYSLTQQTYRLLRGHARYAIQEALEDAQWKRMLSERCDARDAEIAALRRQLDNPTEKTSLEIKHCLFDQVDREQKHFASITHDLQQIKTRLTDEEKDDQKAKQRARAAKAKS